MSLTRWLPSFYQDYKIDSKYAVIIDSGSSGSRVYVYSWPDPAGLLELERDVLNGTLLGSVPQITTQKKWNKKTTPGISTFVNKGPKKLWSNHLKELIEHAESIIPKETQYETPIFLLATAGMRLLPEEDQKVILDNACTLFKDNTRFYIPECSTRIQVIDGETEGLYGWLALNYLLGEGRTFSNVPVNLPNAYGFMDMGGASAQIAFAPNSTESARHLDDLFKVHIRTMDGSDNGWNVFVSTWLGYGANEARNRFSERLTDPLKYENEYVYDPCTPVGLTYEYEARTVGMNETVSIEGLGNFDACLEEMYPLLQKGLPCKDDPCLFNGVHVPAIDYNTNRFVGVSEYWYTANDVLGLGGKYDFETFSSKTREFCEKPWSEIVRESKKGAYNGLDVEMLKNACFKSTWIINILHEGFGLPMKETGNNYKRNIMLDVRSLQTFLDPFQSANTINGNELSWTLGRALLYSSSQIAPSSSNMHEVGFTPAQMGNEIPQFVVGGELLSSFPPVPMVDSSNNKLIFQLSVFVLLVLGICYYGLSNLLSKSQRHFIRVSIKNRLHLYFSVIAKKLERIRLLRHDDEYRQRLMEEDELESMDPIRMKEFGRSSDTPAVMSVVNTPVLNASSFYNLRPFGSAITLGATTSMLDLKSIPSRASSRLSMRPETVSSFTPYIGNGSASFSIDQEEPDESIRSTLQRSKSAFLKLYNF